MVYNTRLPESKAVAEYYAKLRQVPAKQIFGFALTTDERMSRDEFRDSLQLPLAHRIEAAGLWQFGSVTNPATNGQPGGVEHRVVASKIRYAGFMLRDSAGHQAGSGCTRARQGNSPSGIITE